MDELVCLADAARAMRQKGVSSVLVSRTVDMQPVGIVTERDILYRVVAEHRSSFKTVLKEVMSSPLVTIDELAPVKEAVVLIRKNDIRRIPVTKEGKIIGMLTLKSVIGDAHKKSIELIEVQQGGAEKVACPTAGQNSTARRTFQSTSTGCILEVGSWKETCASGKKQLITESESQSTSIS